MSDEEPEWLRAWEEECNPTQGQAFFYYGNQPEVFRDVFGTFGFIR